MEKERLVKPIICPLINKPCILLYERGLDENIITFIKCLDKQDRCKEYEDCPVLNS